MLIVSFPPMFKKNQDAEKLAVDTTFTENEQTFVLNNLIEYLRFAEDL